MTTAFPFLTDHDIVPALVPTVRFGAAASTMFTTITMKNCDNVACLLQIEKTVESDAGVTGRVEFFSCSGVDGSDEALIEPITYREKSHDGSDTWGAATTIADGMFDIGVGGHCPASDVSYTYLFEFNAAEIYAEGIAAADDVARTSLTARLYETNADGSDALVCANWILHPLRYSNTNASSFDNRTD